MLGSVQFDILKAEITTDPLTRGYSAMSDLEVAVSLNTVNRTRNRDYVSGWEIFNATNDVEYNTLTDAQKSAWDALCAIEQIDTASGVAKAREAELFGAGTTTRSNLQALRQEDISRATELELPTITSGDVEEARR